MRREIAFYFDPNSGFWWLEDNACMDCDCLDVDDSASFDEQYREALELVGCILKLRGIDSFEISQSGQLWVVRPVSNVALVGDDSDDDDFIWLQ
jgi:hypothetical protein